MATATTASPPVGQQAHSKEDQTQLLIARLMEGGQEDEETCRDLDQLTALLNEDFKSTQSDPKYSSICKVIDDDCVDTIVGYLDMRQPEVVRSHATLSVSAYLKAGGGAAAKSLSTFFYDRVRRGTYDDYIVAFCVAAAMFPIQPELTSELFLSEGFLGSLGPLMRRKWKSRKVETACLEMLNAACMVNQCRDAVEKYCSEWLEEVVDQDPNEFAQQVWTAADSHIGLEDGSVSMRRHSMQVQHLAAVILAKLHALPTRSSKDDSNQPRIQLASTTMEELSSMFSELLVQGDEGAKQHSIEGLAYASLQPAIKEKLAHDKDFLKSLMESLQKAPPRSPMTYGALSILANLTRYRPTLSEEEKKMSQLRAYANASGKLPAPDPLDDNDHVSERCRLVFEAGFTPVLVTHSKNGSPASLGVIASIFQSISYTSALRGKLAQQGAVKLLLTAWSLLPAAEPSRQIAAQALARILISTNPALVFGANRATTLNAIRPLLSILPPDVAADRRDLLPTFESLMALTNLASLDDLQIRQTIIRDAWTQIEDLILSSNNLVSKAAVELVCNLVQDPEGIALYADGSPQAKQRLHILLALADAEDEGTRSAAGGALATLSAYSSVVKAIIERTRGVSILLKMSGEDSEDLRHRAAFILYHMVAADGDVGKLAQKAIKNERGVEALTECAKKCRRPEVLEVVLQVLKVLVDG